MRWLAVTVSIAVLVVGLTAQKQQQKSEAATVAFVVDGMHCDNCAANLTRALKSTKGVQDASVSFKEKRAVVKLDEKANPVTAIIEQVHKAVPYRLALLLPVENWANVDRGKAVKTVKEVKGIAEAKEHEQGILVTFQPKASVRYQDLVETLSRAGFKLADLQKLNTHQTSHQHGNDHQCECCNESGKSAQQGQHQHEGGESGCCGGC
jgi:copper chaperone CopZ